MIESTQLWDLSTFFDRVVVISLKRRPERWKSFLDRLPTDWPFRPPLRFSAIDGAEVALPSWWTGGEGAWGCYQSHLQILRDCINEGVSNVLILEDDAICCRGFGNRCRQYVSSLPADWELAYFGGQNIETHLGIPSRVNKFVFQPFNVNRTHAYAVRGQESLVRIVEHLEDKQRWTAAHHIDHHLGEYHKTRQSGVYVPSRWLVAQSHGVSDVNCAEQGFRPFCDTVDIAEPIIDRKMVAVLGAYGSGTSAVAGVLHALGVPMGNHFEPPDHVNWQGHFEDSGLNEYCRQIFKEPTLEQRIEERRRTALLAIWAGFRCRTTASDKLILGGKHPLLSLLGPELLDAWQRPVFIVCDRPFNECVRSIAARGLGWPIDACQNVVHQLTYSVETFLAAHRPQHLRINYEHLVNDPISQIVRITQSLGLSCPVASIREAVKFVERHRAKQLV